MSTGNGASTDKCCMKFDGNVKTHCRWHLVDIDRESVLKAISATRRNFSDDINQRLFAYRSCSAVIGEQGLTISGDKISSDVSSGEIILENARSGGGGGRGYFLRTSVSDICEYRNGSLIRLTDKSGWMVLTKKLFIQRVDRTEESDDYMIYPSITPNVEDSRSAIIIKQTENHQIEPGESRNFRADYEPHRASPRQTLSESSIYLPLALRDYNARRTNTSNENEVSKTSVHMPWNVRNRNRGKIDLRKRSNQRDRQFLNELFLMNCRSAADWSTTCGIGSEGDKCTCREWKSETRGNEGEVENMWKTKNQTVPVLFEEMNTARGVEAKEQSSDISLKCVFAETFCDKRTGSKVFWTSDWCNSKNKNKYVFAVSRSGRSAMNQESFSMNDVIEKRKRNQSTISQVTRESGSGPERSREGSRRLRKSEMEAVKQEEIASQGDSPVNPANRCACCNCSPQHICSGSNEKREEISGFRRLLKDIGLADINLNFLRRLHCDPPYRQRSTRSRFSPKNVNDELGEENSRNSFRNAPTHETRYCDCAREIEKLLNKAELLRKPPMTQSQPERLLPCVKNDGSIKESEEKNSGNVQLSAATITSEGAVLISETIASRPPQNEEINSGDWKTGKELEDADLQRSRITEWEKKLRNFEMVLEDMKRQNEALACKCEEPPRKLQANRLELEIPKPQVQEMIIEKEVVVREEKTEDRDSNGEHPCSSLPSKIEIISEKKVCTCQNCSDIHFIVKQYIPTTWLKKCKDRSHPPTEVVRTVEKKLEIEENSKKHDSAPIMEVEESEEEEKFLNESNLDKWEGEGLSRTDTSEKSEKKLECDKNGAISCECTTKGGMSDGKRCCNCDSKLKLIEDRLEALEKKKPTSNFSTGREESTVSRVEKNKPTSNSRTEKEESTVSRVEKNQPTSNSSTEKEESTVSRVEKNQPTSNSSTEKEESTIGRVESEREKTVSEGETDASSFENIESETDNEVKTKIVSCNSLDFFVGGDPDKRTKCECRENSSCAFKHVSDRKKTEDKEVFFMTNVELFRNWSGIGNYKYCESFQKVNKPAAKTVKGHRDWGNVKSAVTSFFRSKIRRRRIFGRRKGKIIRDSSGNSEIASSHSSGSFIDDCSRSSMPLKQRSFHVLSAGPSPTRPTLDRRKRRKEADVEGEES